MSGHKLWIDITENSNPKVMKITDMSVYYEGLPVTCGEIIITPPGFESSASILVEQDFTKVLTACEMEIQTQGCEQEYLDLPDGVYAIQYQVAPVDQVKVTINHLRTTQANNMVTKAYCKLKLTGCASDDEKKQQRESLREIQDYIAAAKAEAEVCLNTKQAMNLYNVAISKLEKLNCKTC